MLFAQAGLPEATASFLASGLSAILMLAISIPAFLFADKWGRRTSAITGGIGLSSYERRERCFRGRKSSQWCLGEVEPSGLLPE